MILTSCSNSATNRLFSKQNILITDYGQEELISQGQRKFFSRPNPASFWKKEPDLLLRNLESTVLFFFGRLDRLETAIEQQVINDLKSTRQKEGQIHQRCIGEQGSGERQAKARRPVVRAIPVMPAAAERSSGATTAMV